MRISRAEQVALILLGAAVVAAVLVFGAGSRAPQPMPLITSTPPATIKVHVTGEVVWPGSYLLAAGARLQDAIFAAHGPTVIADLRKVNLAAVLRDGDRVVIPRIVQPTYHFRPMSKPPPAGGGKPAPSPGPAGAPAAPNAAGETSAAVNVNTATAEDLERLPGVGPVLARRIVAYREEKGLFRRLDDLLGVQGVGPKLLRRLEPLLRLE